MDKKIFSHLIFCFLIALAFDVHASMSKSDAKNLFDSANRQYQQAAYDSSIEMYEEILSSDWQSSALFYNLGNAYKKRDELGRAVLNYERALLIKPRDADINANYKFVLSEARVSRKSKEMNFIQKQLQKHVDFYSFNEMVLIMFGLALVAALIFLFQKWFDQRRGLFVGGLFISISLFLIFTIGFILKHNAFDGAYIVLTEVGATYEPRADAVVHYNVRQGEKVKVVKELGGWVKVRRKDNKLGWVEKKDVESIL